MIGLLLITLIVLVGWAVSVYLRPFRYCPRCGGTGRKKGSIRRFRPCSRCGGTGHVQRVGSRAAHRAALSVRSEITRTRRR